MTANDVSKVYYARVIGNFKDSHGDKIIVNKWVYCVSEKYSTFSCEEESKLNEE
jgi:hypothetical protein